MRILLTGATGFVGSRLLDFLLNIPEVELVLCTSRDGRQQSRDRVRWIHGDLATADWHADIGCVDAVIHVAADASFVGGKDYDAVNYEGTIRVLECARRAGARHFVFFSSIGAVDRAATDVKMLPLRSDASPAPRSAYGRAKLRAEHAVRNAGIPWTIIRPAWVYGRGMRVNSHLCVLAKMAKARAVCSWFAWPGRVSLVHVDDLCAVVTKIVTTQGCLNQTLFAAAESVKVGDILRVFSSGSGWGRAGTIPVPQMPFRLVASRMHPFLPLTVANLFTDYLTCETAPFLEWLAPREPLAFRSRYEDVQEVADPFRKTWLVTGAGSGIGLALCRMLAVRGVQLVAVDRAFSETLPESASRVTLDLESPDAVSILRDVVDAQHVAVVVNNAGVGVRGDFAAHSSEQLQAMLAVNVEFPVRFAHAVIAGLVRRRGMLINVASSMAGIPLPGMCVYTASKGFLQAWSLGLAAEMRDVINVLTISPSGTNTNFQRTAGVRGGQSTLLHPDQVAVAIVRGVEAGKKYVFVGRWWNRAALYLGGLMPPSLQAKLWGALFGRLR